MKHNITHTQQICILKLHVKSQVVADAFNPSTQEAEAGGSLEFEASLVYKDRV